MEFDSAHVSTGMALGLRLFAGARYFWAFAAGPCCNASANLVDYLTVARPSAENGRPSGNASE